MRINLCHAAACAALALAAPAFAQSKQPITLDEYMNTTAITAARLAPNGSAAVIATEHPDWKHSIYRSDLWLWTPAGGLQPLTHSGSEEDPQWSPDGQWIAFASDRDLQPTSDEPAPPADADDPDSGGKTRRIWLIRATGGEAIPLYTETLEVHTFSWSPDSSALYFSATTPLTAEQKEDRAELWHDVVRWRTQDRGDVILKLAVKPAVERALANPLPEKDDKDAKKDKKAAKDKDEALPHDAVTVASSALAVTDLEVSPDGKLLAFLTGPIHHRTEDPNDFEIYVVAAGGGSPRQLTHNQALESNLRWSPDSKWLHFQVSAAAGSLEGPYRDVQGRLYRIDPAGAKVERLGAGFTGSFDSYALLPDGRLLALGEVGTETQVYLVNGDAATKLPGKPGTYAGLDAPRTGSGILVRHSTVADPAQVYLAADPLHPEELKALTALNPIFAERARPEYEPYQWKMADGRTIEGMLIYPPGKKGAKHLRMLTLIHGGPADADGNRFGADWYDWATLAATRGWLVFRPNYCGSTGYGDEFMLAIAPHLVSAPGREILAGVDALVKEGIADGDHLAIGGYSYGGYMTNWLITQTTRFRSAVTGAGAVEHAANWGNDDLTFDDAWFLGGRPWENAAVYQSEAALFQFDKVKTPTHLVQGGADVRVAYLEGELLERALQSLNVPHAFLVLPGEGHSLAKNPWHGYIKLREELKWIEKYDGK